MSLASIVENRVKETVKHVLRDLGHTIDDGQIDRAYAAVDGGGSQSATTSQPKVKTVEKKQLPKKDAAQPTKKVAPPKQEESNTCQYRKTRGANPNEVCGKKASVQVDGEWYCGTKKDEKTYTGHAKSAYLAVQKRESTTKVEKAAKPKTNVEAKKASNEATQNLTAKATTQQKARIVQDKKTGLYVHRETNMVFDKVTKKAIGTFDDSDTPVTLTQADMKVCDEHGWTYDEPVEDEEDEVELGDDDIVEEDEEDEDELELNDDELGEDEEEELDEDEGEEEEDDIDLDDEDLDFDDE